MDRVGLRVDARASVAEHVGVVLDEEFVSNAIDVPDTRGSGEGNPHLHDILIPILFPPQHLKRPMLHQRADLEPHIHNHQSRRRVHECAALLLTERGHVKAGVEELLQQGLGESAGATKGDGTAEGGDLSEEGGVDLVALGERVERGSEPGELFGEKKREVVSWSGQIRGGMRVGYLVGGLKREKGGLRYLVERADHAFVGAVEALLAEAKLSTFPYR